MTDPTPSAALAGIREREQAATPGEWRHRTVEGRGDWTAGSKVFSIERVEADARPGGIGVIDAPADAEFIAMARAAVPALVAALETALAALARHQHRITDSKGECCAGCLEPWPCPDSAEVITAGLTGEERSDER